jgi:uncharacterized protein HemX
MDEAETKLEGTGESTAQPGGQVAQPTQTPAQPATADSDAGSQPTPAQPTEGGVATEQDVQVGMPDPKGGGRKWMFILGLVLVVGIGAITIGFISGRKAREAKRSQREERVAPTPMAEEDALTDQYEKQSSSDEIADIEADLNATSFEGIDEELTDIDKELSSEE